MLVECTCQYCGFKWEVKLYNRTNVRCGTCNDKNVKIKDPEDKVDYYKGAPAFEDNKSPIESDEYENNYYAF